MNFALNFLPQPASGPVFRSNPSNISFSKKL